MIRIFSLGLFFSQLFINTSFAVNTPFYLYGYRFVLHEPGANSKQADSIHPKPLVVMFHGCTQTADRFLGGTEINQNADERGFYVLYPEQSVFLNYDHCWNWFLPQNQVRSPFNEPGAVIAAIKWIEQWYPIDKKKIFAAGLSAGAVMTSTMLACYPDVFSGGAMHSGLAFKSAQNVDDALDILLKKPKDSIHALASYAYACAGIKHNEINLKKILVLHGLEDKRVAPLHSRYTTGQFLGFYDLQDDGRQNGSTHVVYSKTTFRPFGKYPYTLERFSMDGKIEIQTYWIEKLAHAWSGGNPDYSHNDRNGYSANKLMLDAFGL